MMAAFLEGKDGKCKASWDLPLEPNNAISILLVKTSPGSRSEEIDSTLDGKSCKAFVSINNLHNQQKKQQVCISYYGCCWYLKTLSSSIIQNYSGY